ncbi:nitroreductase family protein [Ottowia beijingensis]|uniref:nitroreductase family protein n=1 Tax=Ottowia beijingensis TaxID=1207057 RepID=UPI00363CC3A4
MNKLVWVFLPLLAAALLAGALALRGRLPTRARLNAISSLLLLVYLLATAGLGIFWVANQHLPVFDWHYLFGYATVLLVVLHLAFNLRALLAALRPRRQAASAPAAAAPRRRRLSGALALGGLAASTGGAYWLGLRHGRTELHIGGDPAGLGDANQAASALAVVEAFHAHSAHSRAGVLRRAASADWGGAPPPFKTHAQAPAQPLPAPWRTAPADPPGLNAQALATLLWAAAGITAERGGLRLRAAPSSGALFATELYLAVRQLPGVPSGLWHVDVPGRGLRRLAEALPPALAATLPPGVPVALLATAVFRRSGHKYGERTYRYLLGDLGHALENVRVAGQALHVGVHFARAFDESVWADALQLDEREEGVLAQLWLTDAAATPRPVAPPADWAIPLRQGSAPLGMTDAVHRATSLRAAASGAGSVRASPTDRPPPAGADWPPPAAGSPAMGRAAAVALPAASGPVPALADPLPLIAARRSVRRYRPQALPLPVLGQLLRAMTTPAPQWSAAVRASVVAHAVDGLPAGAWAWVPVADALHARPAAGAPGRRRSRAAGLDQDAIGDAAAVVVLTLDRGAFAADPAGAARGWRHAFLESGLWGERLYLAGQALGVGVCAVGAFYDDAAAALIGADPAREWVVQFAALGWPA